MSVEPSPVRRPSHEIDNGSGRSPLGWAYISSASIAVLLAAVSIIGLLGAEEVYPTEALQEFAVPNDLVSLIIGVPMLVGSMWFTSKGSLVGRLFWPGALMYVLYVELAYTLRMPVSWTYLAYVVIAVASLYTLVGLVTTIDSQLVRQQLAGKVPTRLCGGALIAIGSLTFVRVFVVIASALMTDTTVSTTQLAVLLTDSLLSPAWVIGGVLLWKRTAFGYAASLGLLFQASMLFVGLIVILITQPWLTDASFVLLDVVVVAVMGLVCFVPFALFLRAARNR